MFMSTSSVTKLQLEIGHCTKSCQSWRDQTEHSASICSWGAEICHIYSPEKWPPWLSVLICLCFILQSGDFLTVDRCKVQASRYQDDSITDTTVGVCLEIAVTVFHSISREHPSRSDFSFLTRSPFHSVPFPLLGLSCFPRKSQEGGSRQRRAENPSTVSHCGSAE